MGDLLSKLESYRILNYLLPGTVFIFACDVLGIYKFESQNLFVLAFIAYFLGMTLSRIGSLFLEKPLEWIGFTKRSSYDHFILAEKADNKISTLMEEANTYRTIVATATIVGLADFVKSLLAQGTVTTRVVVTLLLISLILIYLFAYRKQVKYLARRIEHWNK
jgi:hypothetical protein